MGNNNRAAQFMPFDALRGYKEEITRRRKIIVPKKELMDNALEELDYIIKKLQQGMMATVVFFENDEYIKLEGLVSEINYENKFIRIVRKKIYFTDIYSISCEEINTNFFD